MKRSRIRKAELKDTGLQVIYWGLETNGLRIPSKAEPKSGDDLPAGPKALLKIIKSTATMEKPTGLSVLQFMLIRGLRLLQMMKCSTMKMLQQLRIDADSLAKLYDAVRI
ncbi:MAG: hypothetical protein U0T81_02970 [Saprospiraceae bacterium]